MAQRSTLYKTTSNYLEKREEMKKIFTSMVDAELILRDTLTTAHKRFYAKLRDEQGDVPGWVLVVLMTTGLVTALWTIAAPRLSAILRNSLDAMNGIR